ncbi:MAG: AraC-like DNA-binding protein [Phycisphaerales bacterium]
MRTTNAVRDNTVHLESDPQITRLETPLLRVGHENRAADAVGWGTDCVTGPRPTVAFSLLPIRVTFAGQSPVVLAPTTLATPSGDQVYQRTPLSERGQRTVFLTFKDDTLARLVAAHDPAAIDRPGQPVAFKDSPADPAATATACALVRAAITDRTLAEAVQIEDAAVAIVSRAIEVSHAAHGVRPVHGVRPAQTKLSPRSHRLQRDAVNAVCAYIHTHLGESLSLDQLSDIAELSPGYLSRIFASHTGRSLSKYLIAARVLHALARLPDYRRRLTALARISGFASHAHMTSTFTASLGRPPTSLQDDEIGDLILHPRHPLADSRSTGSM